jgi:polysaccharide biosynthesis protein PslG
VRLEVGQVLGQGERLIRRGALRRRARAWVLAFALGASVLVAAAPSAAALPARFWGVVPQSTGAEPMQLLHRGGVRSVRTEITWSVVQPTRFGGFNWAPSDAMVGSATRAGLEVLPVLYGAPRWAVHPGPVPGADGAVSVPRHLPAQGRAGAGWEAFVRAAVERYGPRGSFWAENPDLPRRPIRTWQIWNEENFKYFVRRPRPGEYGRLVEISDAALRAADPGARLLLGGLFARPLEATRAYRPPRAYFATDFLERMYRSTPGIRRHFDGVALHPYTATYTRLRPEIEAVRRVLRRNRDGGKGLWITELGWSSERPDPRDAFAVGWRGQARQLRGAFRLLRSNQRRWRIRRVYWFSVENLPDSCNFCGGSGLFAPGFRAKPSWHAYVGFAGGRAR